MQPGFPAPPLQEEKSLVGDAPATYCTVVATQPYCSENRGHFEGLPLYDHLSQIFIKYVILSLSILNNC